MGYETLFSIGETKRVTNRMWDSNFKADPKDGAVGVTERPVDSWSDGTRERRKEGTGGHLGKLSILISDPDQAMILAIAASIF